jgi:hypothetical protein
MKDTTEVFQVIITPIYFNYHCKSNKFIIFAISNLYCMN